MSIIDLLAIMVRLAAPTLLVTLGGILSFRIKVFPMGLEGYMLAGSFVTIVGTYYLNSPFLGALCGLVCGLVLGFIYSVFVIELDVNPVVCAFAIITIVTGLTRFLMVPVFGVGGRMFLELERAMPKLDVPLLNSIPVLNTIFNKNQPLVYVALLLPFAMHFWMYRTSSGLMFRAASSSQDVMVAAGGNYRKTQYLALILTGGLAALGGAQLAAANNLFDVGMTNGRGFTAIAAMVLAKGEPVPALFACMLFGFCDAVIIDLSGSSFPSQILSMLPYVMAILVAALPAIFRKTRKQVRVARMKRRLPDSKR